MTDIHSRVFGYHLVVMTRVVGTGISTRNPFGSATAGSRAQTQKAEGSENLGQQVKNELFGKKKPPVVDPDSLELTALVVRLRAYAHKLARLAGDTEDDYRVVLAEGTLAMIDEDGTIYVGRSFLWENRETIDLLVGVIAHEVGHRPKRWDEYRHEQVKSRAELAELCRLEETYADFFAGRALAEFGMSPEPLCSLLRDIEIDHRETPHAEYFSAHLRCEVILDGYRDGQRQSQVRRKMFPELAKRLNPKLDLGSG